MTRAQLVVLAVTFVALLPAYINSIELEAFERRLRKAVAMCGLNWTDFCVVDLKIDPTQLKRQFAGAGVVNLGQLLMAPREVRQAYALLEVRDLGLPSFAVTAVQVAPLLQQ